MKNSAFISVLFLFAFSFNAVAAEKMVEPITAGSLAAEATNVFSMTVTGDGNLSTKPGALFTAGEEAPGTQMPYLISYSKTIAYPRWAVHQGWEGEVVLAIEILENGHVGAAVVMESSGYKILDDAALKAIKDWRFQAATLDGKAFRSCVQLPVNFQLRGE